MEAICTPTIATAAIFTALIFLDVFRREYTLLPGHGFFGIVSILLVSILCQNGATAAAWGLLSIPFVILILGWMLMASDSGIVPLDPREGTPYQPTPEQCAACRKKITRCVCKPKA